MTTGTLYTIKEVASLLKVTRRTIYNYLKADELQGVKIGKEWRISEDSVKRVMEEGINANYMDKLQ